MTKRKAFKEAVFMVVQPALEQKGFVVWQPPEKSGVPFMHLRRRVGSRWELTSIQFDKHGRLGCFVNLAQFDGDEALTRCDGVLPAELITTSHLPEFCRLRGNSFSGMFKPRLRHVFLSADRSGNAVGEEILTQFFDAEKWFATRQSGSNLRCYHLSVRH